MPGYRPRCGLCGGGKLVRGLWGRTRQAHRKDCPTQQPGYIPRQPAPPPGRGGLQRRDRRTFR